MPVPKPKEPAVGSRSEKGRASSEWVEEGGKTDTGEKSRLRWGRRGIPSREWSGRSLCLSEFLTRSIGFVV